MGRPFCRKRFADHGRIPKCGAFRTHERCGKRRLHKRVVRGQGHGLRRVDGVALSFRKSLEGFHDMGNDPEAVREETTGQPSMTETRHRTRFVALRGDPWRDRNTFRGIVQRH